MHTSSLLFSLAVLPAAIIAAPAKHIPEKHVYVSHRVTQIAKGRKPHPAVQMHRDYIKRHRSVPSDVARAAAVAAAATPTQEGTVQASAEANDIAYLCPVQVGGQTVHLDFDTGSSDLWVFSSELPARQQKGHNLYNLGGHHDKGETWDISYGDGSGAKGIVYADQVVVGGATATVQAVEVATSVSARFAEGASDGLLGLGFDDGNTCAPDKCYTFMDQLLPTLPDPLFTATLRYHAAGEFDFGYIDPNKYTGTIAYTTVNDKAGFGYWQFDLQGYSIGDAAQSSVDVQAIADTGTTFVYVPQKWVKQYYSNVASARYSQEQAAYVFKCTDAKDLPDFSIYINGEQRTMPGRFVNYATLPNGICLGGLQASTPGEVSILGDIFLKSQFMVFDVGNKLLGFAQQAGVQV